MSSSNNDINNKSNNEINNNNNNNNYNNNNNFNYDDYYDDYYNYDEQNQNQNQNQNYFPQNMWNDYGPWYPPMWGFFNHHWFGFEGDHEHFRGRGRGRGHPHHSPSPHHQHHEKEAGREEHHHRNPPPPEWFENQNFGERGRGRGRPPYMRGFIPPPFFRGGRGRGRGMFHHPPPFEPHENRMPPQSFWNHFRKNLKVGEKCPCCGQKIEKLENIKEDEMKTPFPFMNKDNKNDEKK